MPMRNFLVALLISFAFIGCKSIQEPWAWMDEPNDQTWIDMQIEVFGRTVYFSVPDSSNGVGTSAIRTMRFEESRTDNHITVPIEYWSARATRITGFDWERYWGGYFSEDQRNYALSLSVEFAGDDVELLDETIVERQERRKQDYLSLFKDSDPEYAQWKRDMFKIGRYKSSQGYVWTVENWPPRVLSFETFVIPISDRHEITFDFYYRMENGEPQNSEAWYERRKAISRKILDTVRIEPELNQVVN